MILAKYFFRTFFCVLLNTLRICAMALLYNTLPHIKNRKRKIYFHCVYWLTDWLTARENDKILIVFLTFHNGYEQKQKYGRLLYNTVISRIWIISDIWGVWNENSSIIWLHFILLLWIFFFPFIRFVIFVIHDQLVCYKVKKKKKKQNDTIETN